MITLKTNPGQKVLELGGGANPLIRPNVDCRYCTDANGNQTVDFTADFNEPLPITSDEWDAVFSRFVVEHLSYRKVPQFLSEVFRIIKPGGKVVIVTANTPAQIEWIMNHPEGWDGRNFFDSASCKLFGDQDYPENSHKNFMSFDIIRDLFTKAGFVDIQTTPYGERDTDMVVQAVKPVNGLTIKAEGVGDIPQDIAIGGKSRHCGICGGTLDWSRPDQIIPQPNPVGFVHVSCMDVDIPAEQIVADQMLSQFAPHPFPSTVDQNTLPPVNPVMSQEVPQQEPLNMSREEMFDKHYFNGGDKVGGYREIYRDSPYYQISARHILSNNPQSVLELGAARGYVLKRIQDAGIRGCGLEISKHCWMTRVAGGIICKDICELPWPYKDQEFDFAYSMGTFEHIPEEHLPNVLSELKRTTKRGLHGIDFGEADDGFDRTKCTLRSREWWLELFRRQGLTTHTPVDKESIERGDFPPEVLSGDGKIKLNLGSFTTMYHHGFINVDVQDLHGWAQTHGYKYLRHDIRNGLPYKTGEVSLIMMCHSLEHLTYREGLSVLRECRRVIKPDGLVRIIVPNAGHLIDAYTIDDLEKYDEINDGCSDAKTSAGKLWSLLHEGHASCYDSETLNSLLGEAGFEGVTGPFPRVPLSPPYEKASKQMLTETLDVLPALSLYAWGIPQLD